MEKSWVTWAYYQDVFIANYAEEQKTREKDKERPEVISSQNFINTG